MISAKEAYAKSNDSLLRNLKAQRSLVNNSILDAISKGKFECYVNDMIDPIIRQELVDLGYNLYYNDNNYDIYFKISWEVK